MDNIEITEPDLYAVASKTLEPKVGEFAREYLQLPEHTVTNSGIAPKASNYDLVYDRLDLWGNIEGNTAGELRRKLNGDRAKRIVRPDVSKLITSPDNGKEEQWFGTTNSSLIVSHKRLTYTFHNCNNI